MALADSFDIERPDGLALPTSPPEAKVFMQSLNDWLMTFPKDFGHSSDGGYVRKSFLRKIALWAQQKSPTAWADMSMAEILAITPDKCGFLRALPNAWSAARVENKFGINAMMVPCWACSFHAVPQSKRDVFEKPVAKLLWQVLKVRRERGGYEPNMKTLAELMET